MRARLPISASRLSSALKPAPTPITAIRPQLASAARLPGRFGAPTSSRITSNGPAAANSSGARAWTPSAPTASRQAGIAHGRGHARAGHRAELDRRHADAARRAVDEQPLADDQPGLREERVVGGRERLGDAAGRGPVELLGHRHRGALVHDRELGLAATADDGHDAVAQLEADRVPARRDDLAGQLEAGDVGRRARRCRVAARELVDVGAVDARPRGRARAARRPRGPDRDARRRQVRRRGSWRRAFLPMLAQVPCARRVSTSAGDRPLRVTVFPLSGVADDSVDRVYALLRCRFRFSRCFPRGRRSRRCGARGAWAWSGPRYAGRTSCAATGCRAATGAACCSSRASWPATARSRP